MVRPLETATANKLDAPIIPLAAIMYLDIEGDPLYAWTGIGDLDFGSLAYGPDLVAPLIDGSFATSSGWSLNGYSISGGVLNTSPNVNEGAGGSTLNNGIPLTIGQQYEINFTVTGAPNGITMVSIGEIAWSVNGILGYTPIVAGLNTIQFIVPNPGHAQTPNTIHFININNGAAAVSIDNITVKQVIGGIPVTGDSVLDANVFKGVGDMLQISGVSEGVGGSDALEIQLPGVDLNSNEMKQIIRDRKKWQFRRALVWLVLFDEITGQLAGKPFRIKTGRMDNMVYEEGRDGGIIKCMIEGQQAYGDEPLNTRYSEQVDLNPADTSQKWVWALANMSAVIGHKTAPELNQALSGGLGSGGTGGGSGFGSIGGGALSNKVRLV